LSVTTTGSPEGADVEEREPNGDQRPPEPDVGQGRREVQLMLIKLYF